MTKGMLKMIMMRAMRQSKTISFDFKTYCSIFVSKFISVNCYALDHMDLSRRFMIA